MKATAGVTEEQFNTEDAEEAQRTQREPISKLKFEISNLKSLCSVAAVCYRCAPSVLNLVSPGHELGLFH